MNTTLISDPLGKLLRRGRHGPGWLLLTLALVILRATPAAAEPRDAFELQGYERRFDVSPEQAEQRLAIQADAVGVVEDLKASLGAAYAGVWFDNQAGEFVVPVAFGGGKALNTAPADGTSQQSPGPVSVEDQAAIAARFDEYGLSADSYRVTSARSTWEALEAGQKRVDEAFRGQFEKGLVKTALNPKSNAVRVTFAPTVPAEVVAEARAQAAAETRVNVEIVVSTDSIAQSAMACSWNFCDPPLHAGTQIYLTNPCTAGPMVIGNQGGTPFFLTAGHCSPLFGKAAKYESNTANGSHAIAGTYAGGWFGEGNSDVAQYSAAGTWWGEQGWHNLTVLWGPPNNQAAVQNPAEAPFGSQASYSGEYVCHSGAFSGTSCGTVTYTNSKITLTGEASGHTLQHMTEESGMCIKAGDSGGPVFAGHYANGIVSTSNSPGAGQCGYEGSYSEVKEAESRMGVHLAL
jgi:streptogrisin C